MTRGWATTGTSGVAFGVQTAWPPMITSGWPSEVTLVVPVTHWAVTHGGSGGVSGQPAIVHGPVSSTVGAPLTVTSGLGTAGIAWPPCAHRTVAPC